MFLVQMDRQTLLLLLLFYEERDITSCQAVSYSTSFWCATCWTLRETAPATH